MTDAELIAIRDGFEMRVDQMIRAGAGKPLVRGEIRPPLGEGRGNVARDYSWSIVEFAHRCFYLNEQLDAANAALIENAQHYLDHPLDLHDRDSYHWHSEMLCRLIEFYGSHGSLYAGRLTSETEERIMESLWAYAKRHSRLGGADLGPPTGTRVSGIFDAVDAELVKSQTWHVHESENHHVQGFSTAWHFAKLAKDNPAFNTRVYDDGHTVQEHYDAWTEYIKVYCLERAKKGLFIEMNNDRYNGHLLKGVYNFYDFAADETMRALVGALLDLYWATWAQEQFNGVLGGGKARLYPSPTGGYRNAGTSYGSQMAWFYLGIGEPQQYNSALLSTLTSQYRLPLVVMDLALDPVGRGVYEIHQRPLGLAEKSYSQCPDYRLRTDIGGIHRYTYCTPEFIIGTPMSAAHPHEDWTAISAQNRWHGVIFAGHRDARIVPYPRNLAKDNRTYTQQWSVQHKGTLIAQKLKSSLKCGEMEVWFSEAGLSKPREEGQWVFVEADGAYAAVRPTRGGYRWRLSEDGVPGAWLRSDDEWAPVILEVARKKDFADYDAFCAAVQANPLSYDGSVLSYGGLGGHTFKFYADYSHPPEIDGIPVDYTPPYAFYSPFVRAEWDSGVVTIRKGEREEIRDFNILFGKKN